VIGLLNSRTAEDTQHLIAGFKKGLAENDYVDGQNITIEYRWARGRYDRLPALAAELVGRNVSVLVATGGEPVALAARAATSTIPIVFTVSGDPAQLGLAQSFARPGGNATGVSNFQSDIGAKRLGLLRQLARQGATVAFLSNPAFPTAETQLIDAREGATSLGLKLDVYRATTPPEIEAAFAQIAESRPVALIVAADPFFDTRRDQIVKLAAAATVPAIYHLREYAVAGGLISYGGEPARCLPLDGQLHR